jgi:hypothetical protein
MLRNDFPARIVGIIFRARGQAHALSSAMTTKEGIRLRLPVRGQPYKVFWSTEGPRIEAVLSLPMTCTWDDTGRNGCGCPPRSDFSAASWGTVTPALSFKVATGKRFPRLP